jgi:hypothetical protein
MDIVDAYISGSLGHAIYRDGRGFRILEAPEAKPRDALPNEIQWFRRAARELAPAHPEGLPVELDVVRLRLEEEMRFFRGLDGLLIGMDRDFKTTTRRRGISRAEQVLSVNGDVARRIRERFLVPANTREWDPAGGWALANECGANAAGACYRLLAEGFIDRLADDVAAAILEKVGEGTDAVRSREAVLHSGIIANLAEIEAQADRKLLSSLIFKRGEFPALRSTDPSGQILATIIRRIDKRITPIGAWDPTHLAAASDESHQNGVPGDDVIIAAIEKALLEFERRRDRRYMREGSAADVPGIQSQIGWIGDRLNSRDILGAEEALVTLIERQSRRSRAEDLVKTLTAIADIACTAKERAGGDAARAWPCRGGAGDLRGDDALLPAR